jgi:eukaryotic translation initiation factor 2-alpha kinase 3
LIFFLLIHRLAYVATLDGQITALDLINKGEVKWTLPTGSELISSSIHQLELTNNGKMVRMIPSLNGGLYKFDGESIEAVQITADDLLRSSFKFDDELVISGGKETATFGLSARTGQILYECSMNGGCSNRTNRSDDHGVGQQKTTAKDLKDDHDTVLDDVLIVRRQTQTVRAVEPRTGIERWNFSVGYHELEVLKSQNCHPTVVDDAIARDLLDLDLRVVVPEGLVCAFSKVDPGVMLWQKKFDFPIVSAWRMDEKEQLTNVDLFSGTDWLWNQHAYDNVLGKSSVAPSLYLGMFDKQIYIQESFALQRGQRQPLFPDTPQRLRIPWKPFPATINNKWSLMERPQSDMATIEKAPDGSEESTRVTALSVLYASEYINGNGFYLFSAQDLNKTHPSGHCLNNNHQKFYNTDTTMMEGDYYDGDEAGDYEFLDDIPAKVIIMSLWYWWKEILVISLTTALLMNFILNNHRIKRVVAREVVVVERHIEVPIQVPKRQKSSDDEVFLTNSRSRSSQRSLSESQHSDGAFSSRFLNDFDLMQCLGKGGFGVVFEVRNKLDDCAYAIKRIVLPSKQESRDRVMREVKTLANCEHSNIVRYFQAWVETPPPGWQERQDKEWIEKEYLCTSIDIESPSEELSPGPDRLSRKKLDSWISDLKTNECINFDDKICKTKFMERSTTSGAESSAADTRNPDDSEVTDDDEDDDSSFIEFRADAELSAVTVDGESKSGYLPPVTACITNEKLDDSFEIEFRNDVDDENLHRKAVRNCSLDATGSSGHKFWRDTTSDSMTGLDVPSASRNNFSSNNTSHKNDANGQVVPFKKTHRRPMSLDLTSCGKVLALNDPQERPAPIRMYLYIQMQLCQKQSLKEWLLQNDVPLRQSKVVPIFKQIVDAVEYVHLKGLIHRDLKVRGYLCVCPRTYFDIFSFLQPSNIFFSLDGQIRIGDFGLVTDMADIPQIGPSGANAAGQSRRHTQQVGTQLYMSPEQVRGQPYNYKVDIYSLGLILFELLVPFCTEMERINVLKGLRAGNFPTDFQQAFPDEVRMNFLGILPDLTAPDNFNYMIPLSFSVRTAPTDVVPIAERTAHHLRHPSPTTAVQRHTQRQSRLAFRVAAPKT